MTKTVLITGASSGIGRASVRVFHEAGFNVVATMRRPEAENEIDKLANVIVIRLDVEDKASIETAIAAGIDRFGGIDVLVNNAGYGLYGIFESIPEEKLQQQFRVNLFGVMDTIRVILPHFRKRGSGMIINVSSGAGHFTLPMISAYCSSKFALEGFTEALSYELLALGIDVKLIIPHGGVGETAFQQRAAEDFANDLTPPDYLPFLQKSVETFARLGSELTMTSTDVAKVIYEAANDETQKLRYFVGDMSNGWLQARNDLNEEEYIAHMREKFL